MVQRLRLPTLLVSYERGKHRPQELLTALGAFTGTKVSNEARRVAASFVSSTGGYRTQHAHAREPYS